jgi:hypothetical protein
VRLIQACVVFKCVMEISRAQSSQDLLIRKVSSVAKSKQDSFFLY